jgi:NAD(P)-dependent dehydrogenase (short-subunit alcohol dehydrogenase family)
VRGGRIVTATSAARMTLPNYAATKAAIDSLTRTAAVALAPTASASTASRPA